MDAYRSAHYQCKLDGDKVPSAQAIQTLDAGVARDERMVQASVAVAIDLVRRAARI
jgi:hypothetical protein